MLSKMKSVFCIGALYTFVGTFCEYTKYIELFCTYVGLFWRCTFCHWHLVMHTLSCLFSKIDLKDKDSTQLAPPDMLGRTLQCVPACCSVLQCVAACCSVGWRPLHHCCSLMCEACRIQQSSILVRTATHHYILQHIATYCNLHNTCKQHTAAHCSTMQHTGTYCNIL